MLTLLLRRCLLAAFLAGLALLPGSEGWSGILADGDRLVSEHRLLSALDSYNRAAAFPEAFPTAQLRLGQTYLRRGQPQEAAEAFRRIGTEGTAARGALLGLAEASGQLQDSSGSLAALRRALEFQPTDLENWNRLVEQAARSGLRPVEIQDLLRGLPISGREGVLGQRADYLLGACLLEPDRGEGLADLQRASSGSDPEVKGMAVELLEASKASDQATRSVEEARVMLAQGLAGPALARIEGLSFGDPKRDSEVWALRGYALKEAGRGDQAEDAARRSLDLLPNQPLATFLLGSLLVTRGDAEGAVSWLRRALEKMPANPALYAELANALVGLGDYSDAQRALTLALQAAPESGELRLAVARFYVDRQYRVEEGLEAAREALRLTHNSPEALGTEAWALHLLGRSQEAVSPAEQAVSGEPESALLRYRLGSIYEALGQRERAREQYRMVEELDGAGELWQRVKAALADP